MFCQTKTLDTFSNISFFNSSIFMSGLLARCVSIMFLTSVLDSQLVLVILLGKRNHERQCQDFSICEYSDL